MIDEKSTKFEDLLALENIIGIYEGSITEDSKNQQEHIDWFFEELEYYAEKYNIQYKQEKTDKNILVFRKNVENYLLNCLTVVDVEELGYEIAKDLQDEIVAEAQIDWRCDNDWLEQIDGVFTYAYDYLKSFGCKIRNYNGELE